MYRVTIETDGEIYILHDVHSINEQIYEDELSEEMGKTATFDFTIAPNHPNLGKVKPLSSEVKIYEDKELIFWGRVITPSADIYNTHTVQCVGGLSYLADSLQAPFELSGDGTAFLKQVLKVHNSQVESRKQLQIGSVNVVMRTAQRKIDSYTDTLSLLTSQLVDVYGGYLRVREDQGVRYLDYLTNYGGINSQEIRFGKNILDISSEIDASEIVTVIIPEGAETDGKRIDITSVNGGKNYIQDEAAVARWGKIWGYVSFDDITSPDELLKAARDYLAAAVALPQSIELNAFDLSLIEADSEALRLGFWTNVISEKHGIKGTYLLQKMVRHLTAPQNDTITFGIMRNTISSDSANTGHIVSQKIDEIRKTVSKEVQEKIDNATSLITGGRGGYVVIHQNETGQPDEILIMDAPNQETARKVLRFNQNGMGFSTNGIGGPYENAWTIDGQLVADFITAGEMLADRIRGGTLLLGGLNNQNGVLKILDASEKEIGNWNSEGIMMISNHNKISIGTGANGSMRIEEKEGNYVTEIEAWSTAVYYDETDTNVDNAYLDDMGTHVSGSTEDSTSDYSIDCWIGGDFAVSGEKDRVVKTLYSGMIKMAAYETTSPHFGDIGSGIIGTDGMCYIFLDPIFLQTIGTEYHVFLQGESEEVKLLKKEPSFFIVIGTPNIKFSWEVKGKQRGYEQSRMDKWIKKERYREKVNYQYEAVKHIEKYMEGLKP